jgi:hypothetical protein
VHKDGPHAQRQGRLDVIFFAISNHHASVGWNPCALHGHLEDSGVRFHLAGVD